MWHSTNRNEPERKHCTAGIDRVHCSRTLHIIGLYKYFINWTILTVRLTDLQTDGQTHAWRTQNSTRLSRLHVRSHREKVKTDEHAWEIRKKRSILRKDSYSAVSFRIWIYDSDSSLAEWRSIADSSRWYFTLALITVTHCTARGASVTVTDSSCDLCLKPSRCVAVPPVHLSVCLSASVSPFFCPVLCFAVVLGGGVRGQVCRWLADHVETLSLYCKTGSSIVAH